MKRILALLIAMAITAALWAGGTAVYASIYTISTPNLTVTVDDGKNFAERTVVSGNALWEPGFAAYKNIKMECNGKFQWQVDFGESEHTANNTYRLSDVIEVYWCYTADIVGQTRTAAIGNMHYVGTLSEVLGDKVIVDHNGTVADNTTTVTIVLKMRESAGNEYKGLSEKFTMTIRVDAVNTSATNPTETTN